MAVLNVGHIAFNFDQNAALCPDSPQGKLRLDWVGMGAFLPALDTQA